MKKGMITLNETTLRKILRNVVKEMYNPYTDGEGLGMTSYDDDDGIDERYGRYDGGFQTNNCGVVRITDYDGKFSVEGDGVHFPKELSDEDNASIKQRIDRLVDEKGYYVQDAISMVLCHYKHDLIDESVEPTYTQIRNVTGIHDDDEMNAAAECEYHEELCGEIARNFPMGKTIRLNDLIAFMKDKGFTYEGNDDEEESIMFSDGKTQVEIIPKTYYPKMDMIRIHNILAM